MTFTIKNIALAFLLASIPAIGIAAPKAETPATPPPVGEGITPLKKMEERIKEICNNGGTKIDGHDISKVCQRRQNVQNRRP